MKIVIGGSSGFVGTELVRQALANPLITSIIGLSRRETTLPPSTVGANKLKSIVCDNFENYSDEVRKELHNVDACIWTIAVTPMKLKSLPWEETVRVSRDWAITALQILAELPREQATPLRFIYMSGHFAPRERTGQIKVFGDNNMMEYGFLRGEAESLILSYADKSQGAAQSQIAKSGFITAPGKVVPQVPGLPTIELQDISAALLNQAVEGFDKDTLFSDDMTRIGQKALGQL